MIDDIIDTGGTTVGAAERILECGATEVHAAATHAVFSGPAYKRLDESAIKEVVVTDTLPIKQGEPRDKIQVLTIAPLLANAIHNVFSDHSVSEVFMGENQLF
jgi:ribose-phosphate pyrophosphokinase